MRRPTSVAAAIALLFVAASSQAQTSPASQCGAASTTPTPYCARVVEAIEILPARIVMASAGGNPVPGTASTLGMRLGSLPRVSAALRFTGARVGIGGIERGSDAGERSFTATSFDIDASVGLFSGITIAPTLGGFGSIDLLASVGRSSLPQGEGFTGGAFTWAAGARIGLLRESFTAPGASVSVMYRSIGDTEFGTEDLATTDAYFSIEELAGWSLRAAASKRLLGLGLTGGVGYDRFGASAAGTVRDPLTGRTTLDIPDLEAHRASIFADASFTLLVLTGVAEVGWQRGGSADPALSSTRLEDGAWFAGLAFRLSI